MTRLQAIYHIRCDARAIDARAQAIAIEQSVEMPLAAIDDATVLTEIVGCVDGVRDIGDGWFEARISLAASTVGNDAGQLINILFGNTSMHDDVVLHDATIPAALSDRFGGPRHGLAGLRQRAKAAGRAMTCAALKPQGLPPEALAMLAQRLADGGIDYIKDDHGLADQTYAPFAARVAAIAAALRGRAARYVPSITGDLDAMRRQIALASDAGLDTVMVAPMVAGLSNFHRLIADHPRTAFLAHPALAGAARLSPAFHFGTLFRMLGADAVIFPNHGGRFGYSADTCRQIAHAARAPRADMRPCVPVPAGGMHPDRVGEMLDFYGTDIMLLIGGALLEARDRLTEAATAFVAAVQAQPPAAGPATSGQPDEPMSEPSSRPPGALPIHRPATADYRWSGVDVLPYKEDGRALFKAITRQTLFSDPGMDGELRYFEMAAGGFSTLERHAHMHAVLILRGCGHCLVGNAVRAIETRDLITVPPMTWHQFRATRGEPLGFLCMVNAKRDKPQLPTADDLARLKADPAIRGFLDRD